MRIDIATLFPDMCETVLNESIVGRARKAEKIELHCHQIRDYSNDKHRRVDDTPYGGGMGMVMQAEPIYRCYLAVAEQMGAKPHVIYMSPKGATFTQQRAVELSKMDNILIICGHYEGVDQRVIDKIVDEEISIGDYVLTGGELPALVITDAIARMCYGVLSSEECFQEESHFSGLLEYPHYTRPEVWEG
ncbi:MAG: tRNA (guanosine(37)-N1)-methyltransferase TrmD, partial [Oscillospiraceae bacterium]|nr:tRNA (guanosine(37)-N1)-methyltransferase TrmD [Oscillospiraceae bacterium]